MAAPGWILPNQNMVQGLNAPEGYDVNLLKPVSRVLASATGKPENSPDYSVVLDRGGPLVDGLGVRFILCPLDMTFEEEGTRKVMTSGQSDLYERSTAWKRARLVHKVQVVREPQEELRVLRSMFMGDTVLLDRDPPGPLEETEVSEDSVAWIKDDPDLVILKTYSPGSSLLVLADSYASGWKALVDGTEEPILRANVGFRAVPLVSGSHEVTFRYQTPGFRLGLLISGLFALSVLVCLAPGPKQANVS
jgi:hypothetical protein